MLLSPIFGLLATLALLPSALCEMTERQAEARLIVRKDRGTRGEGVEFYHGFRYRAHPGIRFALDKEGYPMEQSFQIKYKNDKGEAQSAECHYDGKMDEDGSLAVFVIGNGDSYMSPCWHNHGVQMMCDPAPSCQPNGVTDFSPSF